MLLIDLFVYTSNIVVSNLSLVYRLYDTVRGGIPPILGLRSLIINL